MDEKQRNEVRTLLEKAAKTDNAAEAINFAQAACNAANALRALEEIDRSQKQA